MNLSKNEKKDAICPFYNREAGKKIFCDGITRQTSVQLSFETLSALLIHRRSFCCSYDFLNCPIADMLWEIWDKKTE